MPKEPKANSSNWNIKISGIDLTMICFDSKRSNDMIYMEPNEKLHKLCNQVLWEVIYAYFNNWDGSHLSSANCVCLGWIDHWSFTLD